ncbi:GNAT family N-acetyltransferase [Vicingus serpentipes]|uniref:GNAT family N-acetyltransferase n=1 Tax=Vicingus serpentipes TaxID=1926625 RepID=A0A5C6RXW1_9FLAO|nr:GNAT family N-acetyltransferase [Vicingus serpentipes]TXB67013.1 GNAT family N-acetyltransferase [Vicingus serpentipes]
MNLTIRPIQPKDNAPIAKVIRGALEDFNANKPGTVYFDPTTDDLFTLFQTPNSAYYIALLNDEIVGGCGIYPTENLPNGYAELVKIYLHKTARGKGIGKALMLKCFEKAKELNYQYLYLESMPELDIAVGMYQKLGFKNLDKPLGNSGHFGCNIWMIKEL